MRSALPLVAAALLTAATTAGCGSNGNSHPSAVVTQTPLPTPTVTATGADATVALNTVVDGLRTHGLDAQITDVTVYTATTDPAHDLGRPGGYVARATFTDTTLPPQPGATSFGRGGTVEIFRSGHDAQAAAGHARDEVAGEQDVVSGAVLLRLSPRAPQTLVDHYRTALHETTGAPATPGT